MLIIYTWPLDNYTCVSATEVNQNLAKKGCGSQRTLMTNLLASRVKTVISYIYVQSAMEMSGAVAC